MNESAQTICYILSLSHSGSTVLDLLLSNHRDILGVGETFAVIDDKKVTSENTEQVCSCGMKLTEDPFWGPLLTQVRGKGMGQEGYKEAYRSILAQAKKFNKKVIVDSSKKAEHLAPLLELARTDDSIRIKVVLLMRDVRGWVTSRDIISKKSGEPHSFLAAWKRFYTWRNGNQALEQFVRDAKCDYLPVSYEQLAFDTEAVLRDIFSFLDLDPNAVASEPCSHIAYGNRTKLSGDRPRVQYDSRWFNDRKVALAALLSPGVMRFNRGHIELPYSR